MCPKALKTFPPAATEIAGIGQKPGFVPVGYEEKHCKGWVEITPKAFVEASNEIMKVNIASAQQQIISDSCMRDVVKTSDEDDHVAVLLTCSHVIKFDAGTIVKGEKFLCQECSEQNALMAKSLGSTIEDKKPNLEVKKGGKDA